MSGTTPFPNELLDRYMPVLGDTEWRIVCTVVRATHGWLRPDRTSRKRLDWLSHAQLKRKTGRQSEAVSRAIHRLVRLELLEVRDAQGRLLPSRDSRRRAGGRLFYGLRLSEPVDKSRKSENRKAKTTKETHTKEALRGERGNGWQASATIAAARIAVLAPPTHKLTPKGDVS